MVLQRVQSTPPREDRSHVSVPSAAESHHVARTAVKFWFQGSYLPGLRVEELGPKPDCSTGGERVTFVVLLPASKLNKPQILNPACPTLNLASQNEGKSSQRTSPDPVDGCTSGYQRGGFGLCPELKIKDHDLNLGLKLRTRSLKLRTRTRVKGFKVHNALHLRPGPRILNPKPSRFRV